ncbi:MAG: hypothetical protein SGARI_007353, partial [Bacillariaceae sp.]
MTKAKQTHPVLCRQWEEHAAALIEATNAAENQRLSNTQKALDNQTKLVVKTENDFSREHVKQQTAIFEQLCFAEKQNFPAQDFADNDLNTPIKSVSRRGGVTAMPSVARLNLKRKLQYPDDKEEEDPAKRPMLGIPEEETANYDAGSA